MRKFFKKSTAITSAALIAAASLSTGVLAADGYTQLADKAIEESAEQIRGEWQEALDTANTSSGANAVYTLTLSDTGKAMAGMFGFDVSWLEDIKLLQNVKFEDNMYEKFELTINDGSIITLDVLLDTASGSIYMSIPELSDGYILMDAEALEEYGTDLSSIDFSKLTEYTSNPAAYLPTADELANLISRYGKLYTANIADLDAGVDTTITAGGVSQDVKSYSASADYEAFKAMADSIAETAIDDEELHSVIRKFLSLTGEDGDSAVSEMQSALEEMRESIAESTEGETDLLLTSAIYADEEDTIVGSSYDITSDGETMAISILYPNDGTTTGLDAAFSFDGDEIIISGTGEVTDEYVTGDYVLSANGVEVLNIQLENAGEDSGKISLSLTDASVELDESFSVLSAFSIDLIYSELDTDTPVIALQLNSSGTDILKLQIETSVDDSLSIPSASDLSPIYNIADETELDSYLAGMDVEAIYNNAVEAGVPEEFIEQVIAMAASSEDDYDSYEYEE